MAAAGGGGGGDDGAREERKLFTITKFTGATGTHSAIMKISQCIAGTVFWSHKKENEV